MYIKDGIAYAGEPELLYEDSAPVEEYDLKCYLLYEDSAPVEEYDLKCYEEAMKDYREDPVTYSLDEVEQELGLR